ncbi:MAG: GcrA family cell cycle regulator [Candidatus Pelagibacter sp.]
MSWTEEKISKLKELWGKGKTASQIAEIIGGITRNAVIGKAHRLNLSAKIRNKSSTQKNSNNLSATAPSETSPIGRKSRRSKFKSLLLSKDYEPAKNLTLEELTDETCKYMDHDKNPNENDARFCGRKSVEKFSYCPLHLMIVFQPKGKKDDATEKDEEIPQYIEKKVKSA